MYIIFIFSGSRKQQIETIMVAAFQFRHVFKNIYIYCLMNLCLNQSQKSIVEFRHILCIPYRFEEIVHFHFWTRAVCIMRTDQQLARRFTELGGTCVQHLFLEMLSLYFFYRRIINDLSRSTEQNIVFFTSFQIVFNIKIVILNKK